MTVRAVLAVLAWYGAVFALGACWRQATRPTACPRGHRDLYHVVRWRCRECERTASRRRLKRRAKGKP